MPTSILFTLLQGDHRAARGLLEQILDEIDEDPEGARLLLDQARVQILAHAHAEARTFYAALESEETTADLAAHGLATHTSLEDLLDELWVTRLVDATYKAKVQALADLLDHHVDEEELHLFPRAARLLGPLRLAELAEELIAEKSRELFRLGDDEAADRLLGDNHQIVLGID